MTSKDYLSQNLARNYGTIAEKYYGYRVSVIDLRNPMHSDGYNLLTLINHYMDQYRKEPDNRYGTSSILELSKCKDDELSEDQRILRVISAVRKGELVFYTVLNQMSFHGLDDMVKWFYKK